MQKECIQVKLLEARDKEGSLWRVSVLPEGASVNTYRGFPIYYSKELIKKVADRLDGAPAFIYQLGDTAFDHFPPAFRNQKDSYLSNLVGWYRNPRVETIKGTAHLVADLYVHAGADSIRKFLKDSWNLGKKLGVSIVGDGVATFKRYKGKMYAWMEDLFFDSADPVTNPATGAQFLSLLESDKVKGGRTMKAVSTKLLKLAEELAPDLISDIEESDHPLEESEAITLVENLMETLNTDSFPEANLKDRLSRLRDTLEAHDLDSAGSQLSSILMEESSEDPEPDTPVSEQPKSGEPKVDLERLRSHFGEETADKLLEFLGDAAYDCLPERGAKVTAQTEPAGNDDEGFWNKLDELQGLVKDGDLDSALSLITAILAEKYPVPQTAEADNPLWNKLKELVQLIKDDNMSAAGELLTAILAGKYPSPYPYPKPVEAHAPTSEPDEEKETTMPKTPVSEGMNRLSDIEQKLAIRETGDLLDRMLAAVDNLHPKAIERLRTRFANSSATEDELRTAISEEQDYIEALASQDNDTLTTNSPLEARLKQAEAKINELLDDKRLAQLQSSFKEQVDAAGLPSPAEQRLSRQLFKDSEEGDEAAPLTSEKIAEAIEHEGKFVNELIGSVASTVTGLGDPVGSQVTVKESQDVVESFFDEEFGLTEPTPEEE